MKERVQVNTRLAVQKAKLLDEALVKGQLVAGDNMSIDYDGDDVVLSAFPDFQLVTLDQGFACYNLATDPPHWPPITTYEQVIGSTADDFKVIVQPLQRYWFQARIRFYDPDGARNNLWQLQFDDSDNGQSFVNVWAHGAMHPFRYLPDPLLYPHKYGDIAIFPNVEYTFTTAEDSWTYETDYSLNIEGLIVEGTDTERIIRLYLRSAVTQEPDNTVPTIIKAGSFMILQRI